MNGIKKKIAAVLSFAIIVMMLPATTIPVKAVGDSYYEEFGVSYEQLFTLYPNYLHPAQETTVVNSLMNAYKAALGEYGGDHDFLPSFIYALDQGGKDILSSEILAKFGIGKSTEEKLIAETSEALMREILKTESELASVTSEISSNFKDLKSVYNIATATGKLQFVNDLKSSCKNLSNSEIDKLADALFKEESKLMSKVGKGIEFWQLIVGIVQLQELQEESICQLKDAMEDNSDFAKALDDLLAEIKKDPVAYMLEYYCTDKALELLSDAIQTAYLAGRFAPSKLTVAVANIVISMITKVYPGAMADEIYQTTLLSSYVSEFSAAIDAHRTQFSLAKVQGKLIGQDDIAEYKYLYSAYITTIRETLKSALDTAKTEGQKGNIQNAIDLCNTFTYETYIKWCMTAVKGDINAGVIAAPGSDTSNATACVKETYPSYGKIIITKDGANIMDRPCSENTDATAQLIESGALNAEYTATGLYLNTSGNYWYRVITRSGKTGYIYSGNCNFKEFLSDAQVTGLDVPNQIDVGSRYWIKGTISTKYTNLSSVSFSVYDQSGALKTGGALDVSGKAYVLDNSALDTATEFNILPAGTYQCVIQAGLENYSASECWADTVTLYSGKLTVGDQTSTASGFVAEGADFISRSDGIWLYPLPRSTYLASMYGKDYGVNDWAGCSGQQNPSQYPYGIKYECSFPCKCTPGCGAHAYYPGGHNGIDLYAAWGTDVYASADGALFCTNTDWPSRGITAIVEHPINGTEWSYYTVYQHLSWADTDKNGCDVVAGDIIAKSGNTDGAGTGQSHLHFEILLAEKGKGKSLATNMNALWEIEATGVWVLTEGFQEGRILNNPALNSPAGDPAYLEGCERTTRAHAGSVMYTFDAAQVSIGESIANCIHNYSTVETPASCTENGAREYTCSSCGDTYSETIAALGHNYVSDKTDATCTTAGYTTYTCSRCGDSYTEKANGWSEWTTEYPADVPENLIEEKIQYSTLEKEYTTSSSEMLEDWISCGTTFSDWGEVQTTTTKPVESDMLRITETKQTGWGYHHWCNYYYNGGNNWNVDSIEYGSPCYWHSYVSSVELPAVSFQDRGGQQAYGGSGSGASPCAYNFYIWFRNVGADVYTYSYQKRNEVNQFYRWSGKWSDWSDEEVTGNEDRQVKTRTVYRSYIGELADHSYSYAVTEEPTSDLGGVLTGTCAECADTTTVTLPVLNTADYTYKITKEPSYTATGTGRYTWNTTTYGTFYFDVTLGKLTATLTNVEVASKPTKTVYVIGESLDTTGLALKATYSDGSTQTITSGFATSGFNSSTAGEKTVTVTYDGKTTTFTVTVEEVQQVDPNAPQIVLESKSVTKGNTVTLNLGIKNNPGFCALQLAFIYDKDYLTLTSVENQVSSMVLTSGSAYVWDAAENCSADGTLAVLTFEVADDAPEGDYEIQVYFMGASNEKFEEVEMTGVSGLVKVTSIVYGDANGDGKVTTVDLAMLRRYLAAMDPITGVSTITVQAGADVNGDGNIGTVDLAMLRRYLAAMDPVTGESTIVLGPR